ncbi:uncharacterized protein K460DRAFT_270992 [Cucurbitaria berberidis CBS 394.84]|uniref:BTB domain-containing protein n=1 Tax=Cucurbitaria berberidis CBS 394.84 TaxID=1168544 RepID=A0A9P4LD93_9PLEO|nr:uncharacterized protein K460DRAFT_270992 [Cucurbitaria berberidis CBS 394.84]KAF1850147.1 hypothetical protein K460DRAFT_270992 [Cucurbitaria berberidis CBS 394.84]
MVEGDVADSPSATTATTATATPHVSLFSPGLPAIAASPSSSDIATANARPHVGTASSSGAARSLPSSLANIAAMAQRTARLKLSDEHPPIVQLQTQIDQAQKSADDPNTPLESDSRTRTTMDLMRFEHTTRTDINRLFSESANMPGSRAPSYNNATGPLYLRVSNEAIPLPDHLYTRGLLEGRHSDITIIAFGQQYNLHRLILDRAPFFTTALSEPWLESRSKEVALHPEEIDHNITQTSFELAIRKLYGVDISKESDAEAIGLFATACWLEMQDLIDSAIESILRQMAPDTLAFLIRLVTTNYYGRSGDRILESAKAMLSRNGWEMPIRYWDDMPGDIIRELIGSDGFFVDSEWDRWVLSKRLLDRRLRQAAIEAGVIQRGQKPIPQAPNSLRFIAVRFDGVYRQNALTAAHSSSDTHADWLALYTSPDIERILVLLDEGIHYIHMEYEQLDFIRNSRDVFGLPVMPERVISNALWQQCALRQRVLNTDESAQELGLCQSPPEPEVSNIATKTGDELVSKGKSKAVTSAQEESEIESESWDGNGRPRKFWIPSSDCNIVLGNGAEPVITTSSSFQRHASRLSATIQPEDAQWATDFASTPSTLTNPSTRVHDTQRPISAGGCNAGQPKPIAYTEFPPFRFSAEFPNPRFLKEKKRVYSRTVSYAGSLWNIYIQKVRSAKNVQLGVYLHRAKEREVDESTLSSTLSQQNNGSVDERIGQLEREMLMRSERRDRRRSTRAHFNEMTAEEDTSGSGGDADATLASPGPRNPLFSSSSLGRRRGATMPRVSSQGVPQWDFQSLATTQPATGDATDSPTFPPGMDSSLDNESDTSDDDESDAAAYANPSLTSRAQRKTRALVPAFPPYVDGRPTIKTYFKIYSPSKGGRMLSIYESAPDRFNFSQSWGWKSSTLMLDEVTISGGEDSMSGASPAASKKTDGKLRFMVVIGNL